MQFKLKPVVFIGCASESRYIGEALTLLLGKDVEILPWYYEGFFELNEDTLSTLLRRMQLCDFAILVFSADDQVRTRDADVAKTRDNVVFEFGLSMGALGRRRAFFVKQDGVVLPSDLAGLTTVSYDAGVSKDSELFSVQQALAPAAIRLKDDFKRLGRRSATGSYISSWGPDLDNKGIHVTLKPAALHGLLGKTLVLVGRDSCSTLPDSCDDFQQDRHVGFSPPVLIREPLSDTVLRAKVPRFDDLPVGADLQGILISFDVEPTSVFATIADLISGGGRVIDGRAVGNFPDITTPEGMIKVAETIFPLEKCIELRSILGKLISEKTKAVSDENPPDLEDDPSSLST